MNIRNIRNLISPTAEIAKLKNGSPEYDNAIDDVLDLLNEINKTCRIVHTSTGLFFNGYDSSFSKGKNTLSPNNAQRFKVYGKNNEEILELAFKGHLSEKEDGKKYVQNNIVYKGSEINKILSEIYSDTRYIPLHDFSVERED